MVQASESALIGQLGQPRRHGPQIFDRGVVFNLWAPSAQSVDLVEVGIAVHVERQGRMVSVLQHLSPRRLPLPIPH
jgi:hypothetical protein